MTSYGRWDASAGIIALALAVGCDSPERQAAEAARNSSEVAVTAEQKQLWQDAADRGDTPGLQRVPVLEDPVDVFAHAPNTNLVTPVTFSESWSKPAEADRRVSRTDRTHQT